MRMHKLMSIEAATLSLSTGMAVFVITNIIDGKTPKIFGYIDKMCSRKESHAELKERLKKLKESGERAVLIGSYEVDNVPFAYVPKRKTIKRALHYVQSKDLYYIDYAGMKCYFNESKMQRCRNQMYIMIDDIKCRLIVKDKKGTAET